MLGRKVFFFDPDQIHKMSKAANASSCHTADARLLAAYSKAFHKAFILYFLLDSPSPLPRHHVFSLVG